MLPLFYHFVTSVQILHFFQSMNTGDQQQICTVHILIHVACRIIISYSSTKSLTSCILLITLLFLTSQMKMPFFAVQPAMQLRSLGAQDMW